MPSWLVMATLAMDVCHWWWMRMLGPDNGENQGKRNKLGVSSMHAFSAMRIIVWTVAYSVNDNANAT